MEINIILLFIIFLVGGLCGWAAGTYLTGGRYENFLSDCKRQDRLDQGLNFIVTRTVATSAFREGAEYVLAKVRVGTADSEAIKKSDLTNVLTETKTQIFALAANYEHQQGYLTNHIKEVSRLLKDQEVE